MNKPKTIDEYIALFDSSTQKKLQQIRQTIKNVVPEATEKISYAIPTFYLHGNLVHFAAYPNHIGFYALPSGNEAFEHELAPYHKGKGSVQFPIDAPMPLDLIEKIVLFRADENRQKRLKR